MGHAVVHCDDIGPGPYVTQYSVFDHLQVLMFKNVPAGPVEAVLQLLRGIIRPSFNNPGCGKSSFLSGVLRYKEQGHMVRLAQVW